jgi:WD40 repeat protein
MFATMHRRVRSLAFVGLLVVAGACTPSDAKPPEIVEDGFGEASATAVDGLDVSAERIWGLGRAVQAVRTGDALAVATTTGVHLVPAPAADPVLLDQFEASALLGPIAVSDDATRLAVSMQSPAAVRIYDLSNPSPLVVHDLPTDVGVRALTFEPGGHRLTIETTAGLLVADDASSAPHPLLEGVTTGRVARLPDGVLVAPLAGTADLAIGSPDGIDTVTLPMPAGTTVLDAHSSPEGSVVAVSVGTGENLFDREDQILLLDPATLQQRAIIDIGHPLDPLQWGVSDSTVAVAEGPTLTLWTPQGTPLGSQTATDSAIVALHPVAGGLLSQHADGTVVIWASESAAPTVIRQGGISIASMHVHGDGRTATSVDRFGEVATWSTLDGTDIANEDRFALGEATDVAISIDGVRVGVASTSGRVTVLDRELAPTWSFATSDSPEIVGDVMFDPANGALATGLAERLSDTRFDDTVTVWDPDRQSALFSVGGEAEEVAGCSFFYSRVRFNHGGTAMAVTSHDFSVIVLDTATGSIMHELPGTTTVQDLVYTPDDDLLVAVYEDGTVNVWQTTDYSPVASYRAAQGGYLAIAVLPDSATMAAADITGAISLIDLMTGAALQPFTDARFRTSTLALSPDGALLAAPMADASIGIWSTVTGALLTTAAGHTAHVTGLEFSPHGDWLASSSMDGTARTWTIERIS